MRIRIVQRPHVSSIDGIRLDRYEVGRQYDVGNGLAALMLAEQWAEPVPLEESPPPVEHLRSQEAPILKPRPPSRDPTNLIRDMQPPSHGVKIINLAADSRRRASRKRR